MSDNHDRSNNEIPSPCVRNCCLDENDICLGCQRSISEIIGWHTATEDEKREILEKCRLRQRSRPNPLF